VVSEFTLRAKSARVASPTFKSENREGDGTLQINKWREIRGRRRRTRESGE
jgi:hypothetical protein